jgi:ATPase subunit of ABC transporter with duplicated ATPase domains
MLRISDLSKRFAGRTVLRNVSFVLSPGERAGIVGPNGCGKSTLLAILAGHLAADEGSVFLSPGARVGYLRQGYLGDETLAMQELLLPGGAALAAHAALLDASDRLTAGAAAAAIALYDIAAAAFEECGGYEAFDRIESELRELGLQDIDPSRTAGTLSGGQRARLALAALLLETPDLLLLDEPTNHLDIEGLQALESFLHEYPGAALIVSHDRAFLDATVNAVLEIDGATQRLKSYAGDYSAYAAARQREREEQQARFERQERERARVEKDIRELKEQARHTEQRSAATYDHGDGRGKKLASKQRAAKGARKAVVRERKLEKRLETGTVEKPKAGWTLRLAFTPVEGGARDVVRAEGLGKSYKGQAVLRDLDLLVRYGERLVITGPNGGGKTTLLKIVAGSLIPDRGMVRLGAGVVPGYLSQDQDLLDPGQTPIDLLRHVRPMDETEARTLLHAYLFAGDAAFTPIGLLSYGERARLALAGLIAARCNLLLLDEPTNHLDIAARERFEAALAGFTGTTIAVLHDRYAIRRLASRVVELREGRLREWIVDESAPSVHTHVPDDR